MKIAPALAALTVPIGDLQPDPANVRVHGDRNVAAIRASLERFGQLKPVVALRKSKVVVAGNGTLLAAQALGWPSLAVSYVDLTAAEARAYAIADNRTAELAAWDAPALQEQLTQLPEDLRAAAGYTEAELAGLAPEPADPNDSVAVPPPRGPRRRAGRPVAAGRAPAAVRRLDEAGRRAACDGR